MTSNVERNTNNSIASNGMSIIVIQLRYCLVSMKLSATAYARCSIEYRQDKSQKHPQSFPQREPGAHALLRPCLCACTHTRAPSDLRFPQFRSVQSFWVVEFLQTAVDVIGGSLGLKHRPEGRLARAVQPRFPVGLRDLKCRMLDAAPVAHFFFRVLPPCKVSRVTAGLRARETATAEDRGGRR